MPDSEQWAEAPETMQSRGERSGPPTGCNRGLLYVDRDILYVDAEISRIIALAEAERIDDAREVSAALLFDFQPLLGAYPALLGRFVTALRRCKAQQLLRRLTIAVHGEPV